MLDIFLIACCMVGALWLRYDFQLSNIDPFFWQSIVEYLPINIICTVIINLIFRLYTSLWRFASIVELKNAVCAVFISSLIQWIGMKILDLPVPRSYIFILYYAAGRLCDHPQICLPVYPDHVEQPQICFQDQS